MKNLSWKKICSAALAVSLAASVAAVTGGCSSNSSSQPAATSTAPEASTAAAASADSTASAAATKLSGSITVAAWNDAATSMKAEAAAFMKENAGTTVTVQSVDTNYTKLYTELAAGSGVPDVVQTQNRDFQSFMNKYPDAWLDVTDLVKPEESNFAPYVLPLVSKDSKYYAVPWDLGPCALLYRTDIFKSAGIDVSTIKTYDDYLAAGEKIAKSTNGKTKLFGFDYSGSTSSDVENMLFNQLGGKYYGSDGKVDLATDEMVKTLTFMKKAITSGVALNLPNEWNDRITAISKGQLATIPFAVWYTGTLQNSVADQSGKWGVAPLPAFTADGNTQANVGGSILAISSTTQNKDLAKAFVKFALMSSEGNEINLSSAGLFTSYSPSYKDAEYTASNKYFGAPVGSIFSKFTDKIPSVTFGSYYTDVDNALKTAIGNVFTKNEDPAKALAEASATAQKAIDAE